MDCNHLEKISLLVDDKLSPSETEEVKNHLAVCAECRAAEWSFLALRRQIKAIQIPRDPAAEQKVLNEILRNGKSKPAKTTGRFDSLRPALTATALLIVVAVIGILIYNRQPQKSWDVATLEGTPKIAEKGVTERGRLKVGEWLETNGSSRARIAVADIGQVEVEPETKIRLVETNQTEHRLELARGSITAQINAPPRLFFVNTPSATVVDYGCAYSLSVEADGITTLHVTEGWVSLTLNGRESLVPASAYAKSKIGTGPGTPFFEDASGEFIDALTRFDFENGGSSAIDVLLVQSRQRDSLSLWYLLERADESDRARIFDRLRNFVPLPENATRSGVLALDRGMLAAWKEAIEVESVGNSFAAKNQNANDFAKPVPLGRMTAPRAGHTATKLPDGKVLIVGGRQKENIVVSSAEIFDPATKTFTPTGSMNFARFGHTATLLPNNRILIAGGSDANGNSLATAEFYDPATGVFTTTGNLNAARSNHQATLLDDAKILITGGGANQSALNAAELFDSEKGVFLPVGEMSAAREFHAATRLTDGSVLVTGGRNGSSAPVTALADAELYRPTSQTFVSIGKMIEKRYGHAAVLLADGRVLIAGGSTGRDTKGKTASAEIYDSRRNSFLRTGAMSLPRFNHQSATLPLLDGRILIAGAGARLEIFDAVSGSFVSTAGNVGTGRVFSTATALANGEVLITGGYNFDYPPTASAWLYSP